MSETRIGVVFLKLLFHVGLLFISTIHANNDYDECSRWFGNHLPNKIVPRHYNISLTVNENTDIISGVASILLEIQESVIYDNITFHGHVKDINLFKTLLVHYTNTEYQFMPYEYKLCKKKGMILLKFDDYIFSGFYILKIYYETLLYEDKGLVKSCYIDTDGQETSSYVTIFELNGARRLFPCWDDPKMRATFNISVLHSNRYKAFSNMPLNAKTDNVGIGELINSSFGVTPEIPTYLVRIALIDSSLIISETNQVVYIWYRRQLKEQMTFAEKIAVKTNQFFTWYLSKYSPTLKINLIALPQFPGHTIESSTFTVCREEDIVFDENLHFFGSKIKVATAVTQKVADQWLNYFKSPTHWTELWLNKALAIYIGTYRNLNLEYPDWQMMNLFVIQVLQPALRNDIEWNMIPIKAEIDPIYTHFIYSKASSIIRMLEHIVTNMVFQQGVEKYLRNAPQNATFSNFTMILQKELEQKEGKNYSGYNLEEAMVGWLTQSRYPVLTVERCYEGNKTYISQDIVYPVKKGTITLVWRIPVTYTTQSELDFNQTTPKRWLISGSISIDDINSNDWIIFNIQQTGYYRVNYDFENWIKIIYYLNSPNYKNIHVLNRAQLIDDVYYFMMNNRTSASIFIDITKYLKKETDYIPWHSMINILWYISPYFEFSDSRFIKSHSLDILDGLLKNIGYDNDPMDDDMRKTLRLLATKWACKLNHTECTEKAHAKLLNYLNNPEKNPIKPEWEEWTYCAGLKNMNIKIWKKMLDLITSKNKIDSLKYLHCAEDNIVILDYLYHITSESGYLDSLADDTRIKLFLSILKKHVRTKEILSDILFRFDSIKIGNLNDRKKLIHIIMGQYSEEHLKKITEFVTRKKPEDQETVKEVERVIKLRSIQLEKYNKMYIRLL